jgi:RHS repeat-associated protein
VQSSLYDSATYPQTLGTFTYTPFGAVSTITDGCEPTGNCTSAVENYYYNNRLQPYMIWTTWPGVSDCVVLNYYSGASNPTSCNTPSQTGGNNGNVMGYWYRDWANTNLTHTASFGYDSLNRLNTACTLSGSSCQTSGSPAYNLAFSYDQWGNMTCTGGVGGGSALGLCPQLTYDPTTNRLTIIGYGGSQNVFHDAAGNITQDWNGYATRGFTWDAEGRMTSVASPVGTTVATYKYNALGQQVERTGSAVPNGGTLDEYYDAFGKRALVMNGNNNIIDYIPAVAGRNYVKYQGSTLFMHANALGSTGLITSATNSIVQDELFYPWGQQLAVWEPWGGLYSEQFASLNERDPESGLDTTPNRTYSWLYGRWLSPDPLTGSTTNPQSLNRYAYVLNNPTSAIDPLGLSSASGFCEPGSTAAACTGSSLYATACTPNGYGPSGQFGCDPTSAYSFLLQSSPEIADAEARMESIWRSGWDPALGINWNDVDYLKQANGQYKRLSQNLKALFGSGYKVDPSNCDLIGGHCNFGFTCDYWSSCKPGRYDNGIHIECAGGGYKCNEGDPLVVHDDTVSPFVGSFSFSALFTVNFWEHGFVDVIGGTFFVGAFSR